MDLVVLYFKVVTAIAYAAAIAFLGASLYLIRQRRRRPRDKSHSVDTVRLPLVASALDKRANEVDPYVVGMTDLYASVYWSQNFSSTLVRRVKQYGGGHIYVLHGLSDFEIEPSIPNNVIPTRVSSKRYVVSPPTIGENRPHANPIVRRRETGETLH